MRPLETIALQDWGERIAIAAIIMPLELLDTWLPVPVQHAVVPQLHRICTVNIDNSSHPDACSALQSHHCTGFGVLDINADAEQMRPLISAAAALPDDSSDDNSISGEIRVDILNRTSPHLHHYTSIAARSRIRAHCQRRGLLLQQGHQHH